MAARRGAARRRLRATPVRGVPLAGVPRGLLAKEQRSSGPGPRRGSRARRAEPLIGIPRTRAGRGAVRVKQGRATRRLGLACVPGAFRAAMSGLQRPAPHFMPEKTMRRLKALSNSSRKILSRDLYLQKAGSRRLECKEDGDVPAPPPRPPARRPTPIIVFGTVSLRERQRPERAGSQGALRTRRFQSSEQAPPFKIQIHISSAWKRGLAVQIALVRPGLLESPRVNRRGCGGGAAPEQIGRGRPRAGERGSREGVGGWKEPLFQERLPFVAEITMTMASPLLDFN